jgi:short-subunit dehydrogenase
VRFFGIFTDVAHSRTKYIYKVSAPYTLITGASAGIGKELATACARRGFNILLIALPETGLPKFSKHLRQNFGVQADYMECDLADPLSVQDVYDWCMAKGYKVDKLINNAGIGGSSPFETLSTAQIQAVIHLNTNVLTAIINLFIPLLKKQEKAYILNVSSTASFFNIPNKALYAATKAFVNVLTTSLRNELKGTNISLSVLCPGGSTHKVDAVVRSKMSKRFSNLIHEEPATIAEAGVSGMLKEKRMIFPGWVPKMYVVTAKLLPAAFADFLVRTLFNSPRESPTPRKRRLTLLRWSGASTIALLLFITLLFLDGNIPARQAPGNGRTLADAVRYLKSNPSVSAFTTLNSDVAYVFNSDSHLYVYDLQHQQLKQKIPFHDNGRFKGLVHHNGLFYLLREDGYLLIIQKKNKEYEITGYDVPLNTCDNLQGLYLDSANNRLLIDAQANCYDNNKNGMYGFDLATKSFINAGPIFLTNKRQDQ